MIEDVGLNEVESARDEAVRTPPKPARLPDLAHVVEALTDAETVAYENASRMTGEDRAWQHGYAAGLKLALVLLDKVLLEKMAAAEGLGVRPADLRLVPGPGGAA